ncbi:MAG TPA: hypothetical protein VGK96_26450 [Candidatus Sulfotelmatobacter sp.]|jgi:hypothetical protein
MARFALVLLRWKIVLRENFEALWQLTEVGLWLIFGGLTLSALLLYRLPSPGIGVAVMGVVAALMAARVNPRGFEKAAWMILMSALLVVEILAVRKDRNEHDAAMANLLGQTMGGSGYLTFFPTFPSNNPASGDVWPVQAAYFPKSSSEPAFPLMDVNVDFYIRPSKGDAYNDGFSKEVMDSLRTPAHYTLGTVIPTTIFAAPFKMQSGKRYQLRITTRRDFFYENVNIDTDPNAPGGYKVSWCLYRYADNKLLDGKCE